ncbi:MAG: MerR family transcriptional regulator [Flavobacteriales bacterium]
MSDSKLYYSIGEVAEMFNVNASLIRFWEKEFDIIKPKKNNKGNRLFTVQDIDNLKIIYHLVKERGFTLDGAKNKLKNSKKETIENVELINSLQKIKNFLLELKEEL